MPTSPDLYKEKKPLFELCRFLIKIRAIHHGIMCPQNIKLKDFAVPLSCMSGNTPQEKLLELKNKLVYLTQERALWRGGEPHFIINNLEEAFLPNDSNQINTDNYITVIYDRDLLNDYHNDLQVRTKRIMQQGQGSFDGVSLFEENGNLLIISSGQRISIQGVETIMAKIIKLLDGQKVKRDDLSSISIVQFAENNIDAPEDYQPGTYVSHSVLAKIIFKDEWGDSDSTHQKRKRRNIIRRIQAAIRNINRKFNDQKKIILCDEEGSYKLKVD